jgi:hypothetical protein
MQSDEVLRTQKIRRSSFGHQTIKPRKKIILLIALMKVLRLKSAQLNALK